jgi:hypothetical protein
MNATRLIENIIMRQAIKDLLAAGYEITVSLEGEEPEIKRSRDAEAIFKAMCAGDEDWLTVFNPGAKWAFGWVRFIYGNDGWDVLADYTTNLEEVLRTTNALADKLDGGAGSAEMVAVLLEHDPVRAELLDAALDALGYLNLKVMQMSYPDPEYDEIKPYRTKLSLAVSKAKGQIIGGSIPDMELARKALGFPPNFPPKDNEDRPDCPVCGSTDPADTCEADQRAGE